MLINYLQKNYRPPSERGEKIPLSIYTYNADPAEKSYNNYYHITNDTSETNLLEICALFNLYGVLILYLFLLCRKIEEMQFPQETGRLLLLRFR